MTPTTPLESPWRDMASAPKDGTIFFAMKWWGANSWGAVDKYQWVNDPRVEQCFHSVPRMRCIRDETYENGEREYTKWVWCAIPSFPLSTPRHPNELLEAAKEFAEAAAKEFNEKGACGFALARLTDLRTAIRNAEQGGGGMTTFKSVPVEPTEEMLNAAQEMSKRVGLLGNWLGNYQSEKIYKAMLAASPPPPKSDLLEAAKEARSQIEYFHENPSAWDCEFDQRVSDAIGRAMKALDTAIRNAEQTGAGEQ